MADDDKESDLPHDTAKSGIDENLRAMPKTPRNEAHISSISKFAEKDKGPNLISRPEDYTPPDDSAPPPAAQAKGGRVGYAKGGGVSKAGWRKHGW
jgi:hypothetical protein